MAYRYDPKNIYAEPKGIGDWGMPPWEPCRNCGHEMFHTMDWDMGYYCASCGQRFGTVEETKAYYARMKI